MVIWPTPPQKGDAEHVPSRSLNSEKNIVSFSLWNIKGIERKRERERERERGGEGGGGVRTPKWPDRRT